MLGRKVYKDLLAWKNNPDHQCLLFTGARQIGKTFIIKMFAEQNYKYCLEFNFLENENCKAIFEGAPDADALIKEISQLVPEADFVPGETFILLDDIQECPRAITALEFLSKDKRFDVIATGSLLGTVCKELPSDPAVYTDSLEMYSLDFEEFLWANGVKAESIYDIKDCYLTHTPLPAAIHERMSELFIQYIVTGGLPNVVQDFVTNHNFSNVLQIQKSVLDQFRQDIDRYAKDTEKAKITACLESIPKHLSKDYKKFQYSLVEKGGSARKFSSSLEWLSGAGIINLSYNLNEPQLPFEDNAQSDCFKVYMQDTGLLTAMLDESVQQDIIGGNLGVFKGAVYENIIGDIFVKSGKKLYHYEKSSLPEIDFFILHNERATAVEVKPSNPKKSKSLATLIQNLENQSVVKLSTENICETKGAESLPLYMAMFL